MDYDIYRINISNFSEVIAIWHTAYNYNSSTVCAKDQTKVAELIKICKHRQKWIGCIPIDNNTIPATMIMEELYNKISSFKKKATYITVYALSASTLDRNWLGEVYSKNPNFFKNLNLNQKDFDEICILVEQDLTIDILNSKDKQSDKLAERFFLSTVLR
ncbi:14906_t:CDS:2, partial [Gigaspora margarita]